MKFYPAVPVKEDVTQIQDIPRNKNRGERLYNSKVDIRNQKNINLRKNQVNSAILAEVDRACLGLFNCTKHRGRLRISKYACALRYLLAQQGDLRIPDDEFGMARKAGLEICGNCPEGQNRAKSEKEHQHGIAAGPLSGSGATHPDRSCSMD